MLSHTLISLVRLEFKNNCPHIYKKTNLTLMMDRRKMQLANNSMQQLKLCVRKGRSEVGPRRRWDARSTLGNVRRRYQTGSVLMKEIPKKLYHDKVLCTGARQHTERDDYIYMCRSVCGKLNLETSRSSFKRAAVEPHKRLRNRSQVLATGCEAMLIVAG